MLEVDFFSAFESFLKWNISVLGSKILLFDLFKGIRVGVLCISWIIS